MLKPEGPDRYRVDFAQLKRASGWRTLFTPKDVVVDAWAIGQAIVAAVGRCPYRSATGAPQVWNEYALFLSRADHDRLRPIEATLRSDLGPILYEELVRMGAVTVGAPTVRLLVDDADEVPPGTGMLRVRHVPDAEVPVPGAGEITVRLDRPRVEARPPESTQRVGGAVLRLATGASVPLPERRRVVLGRSHPGAGDDHLALPGAGPRVNRRQAWVALDGDHVEIGREGGDANPVAVGGRSLAPGEQTREKLPVEVVLSGGELRLVVQRT